jgi:hypothetical protein
MSEEEIQEEKNQNPPVDSNIKSEKEKKFSMSKGAVKKRKKRARKAKKLVFVADPHASMNGEVLRFMI